MKRRFVYAWISCFYGCDVCKIMSEENFFKNESSTDDIKKSFAYECLSFIQDKKERGHDAKDILEELEDFLQASIIANS